MAAVLDWIIKFTSPITKPKVLRSCPRVADRNGAFTIAQIAEHNKPSDAWIIIDDGVYDVSAWGEAHPGGDVVSVHRPISMPGGIAMSCLEQQACCNARGPYNSVS